MFNLLILLSLFLAAQVPSFADEPLTNVTFDEEHDVFYQEQFRLLSARVKELVPRAYKNVTKQWGLPESSGFKHPLTVQIQNLPSDTLVRRMAAYVQQKGRGDSFEQHMVIDIGAYMQTPNEDLQMIITHEMAHAVLGDLEAGTRVFIPPWFNEGLAQTVTGEGNLRVHNDIQYLNHSAAPLTLCDIDGPVDEFSNGPFSTNSGCYPEYYLAVQRLKQLGGPKVVPTILDGLQRGTKMSELIESLAGMDWPSFKADAEHYAEEVFRGRKPPPEAGREKGQKRASAVN